MPQRPGCRTAGPRSRRPARACAVARPVDASAPRCALPAPPRPYLLRTRTRRSRYRRRPLRRDGPAAPDRNHRLPPGGPALRRAPGDGRSRAMPTRLPAGPTRGGTGPHLRPRRSRRAARWRSTPRHVAPARPRGHPTTTTRRPAARRPSRPAAPAPAATASPRWARTASLTVAGIESPPAETISVTKNGFPWVRWYSSTGSMPVPAASAATASTESGATCCRVTESIVPTSPSSARNGPPRATSSSRYVTTSKPFVWPMRRQAIRTTSSVAASAQCRSSITIGPTRARASRSPRAT